MEHQRSSHLGVVGRRGQKQSSLFLEETHIWTESGPVTQRHWTQTGEKTFLRTHKNHRQHVLRRPQLGLIFFPILHF